MLQKWVMNSIKYFANLRIPLLMQQTQSREAKKKREKTKCESEFNGFTNHINGYNVINQCIISGSWRLCQVCHANQNDSISLMERSAALDLSWGNRLKLSTSCSWMIRLEVSHIRNLWHQNGTSSSRFRTIFWCITSFIIFFFARIRIKRGASVYLLHNKWVPIQ